MTDINIFDRHSWGVIREARNITYRELGEACGVHMKSVTKWFYGERQPGLAHQILLAKALRIDLTKALANVSDPDTRAVIRYALNND
ncbi:helix-turn-helix domain-containing protein [Streptomyces sp. NPDC056190]|uniref:helix-turn-helix domain-containing protein n=1 Tax=Streptomyces sp. NPDC056190 TaxID=3345741 RepID=UPI0035D959E3